MPWLGFELRSLPSNLETPRLDQLSQRAHVSWNRNGSFTNKCHLPIASSPRQTSSSSIQIQGILRRPQSDATTPTKSKIMYKQYK